MANIMPSYDFITSNLQDKCTITITNTNRNTISLLFSCGLDHFTSNFIPSLLFSPFILSLPFHLFNGAHRPPSSAKDLFYILLDNNFTLIGQWITWFLRSTLFPLFCSVVLLFQIYSCVNEKSILFSTTTLYNIKVIYESLLKQ